MNGLILFLRQEDGPTAVEYAVMLALIVGVCFVGIALTGQSVSDSYQNSFDQMNEAFGGSDGGGGGGSGGAQPATQ